MRVSTNNMFYSGRDHMNSMQGDLVDSYEKMSLQKRVVKPSDDPVAASQILALKTRKDIIEQYNKNADAADTNLSLTDNTLKGINDALIRVKELAIQLGSDQYQPKQIKSAATEIKQLFEHIKSLMNTQDSSDTYIFGGSSGDKPAYDRTTLLFQGDAVRQRVRIGDDTFLAMNTSGTQAFENLTLTGVGGVALNTINSATLGANYPSNILGALQYLVDSTGNGTGTIVNKEAIRFSIDNVEAAAQQVNLAQSEAGARQNTIKGMKATNELFAEFSTKRISDLEDLDFPKAWSKLQQQELSLNSSQMLFSRIQGMSLFNFLR